MKTIVVSSPKYIIKYRKPPKDSFSSEEVTSLTQLFEKIVEVTKDGATEIKIYDVALHYSTRGTNS